MSNWIDEFNALLGKMMARKDSEFFREPVAWEEMGLTDYPVVISKPMDLGTVGTNLKAKRYAKPEDAAADVRLTLTNAMTYNLPGSRVYSNAKNLGDYFELNFQKIAKMAAVADTGKPPSVDELTQFVEKCYRLDPENLGKILRQIDSICPDALIKRNDSNEIDVNVDLITGKAFKTLNSMVSAVVPEAFGVANRRLSK